MIDELNDLQVMFEKARSLSHKGDFTKAKELYHAVIIEAQRIKSSPGEALAFLELARIALNIENDFVQARLLLSDSLRIYTEIGFDWGKAHAIVVSGKLALCEGRPDAALQLLDEAMVMFEREQDDEGIASTLNEMFRVEYHNRSFTSAEQYLSKSLKIVQDLGNKFAIGQLLLGLGALDLRLRQDMTQARSHFSQALAIFGELGYTHEAKQARHNLNELDRVDNVARGSSDIRFT